MEQLKKETEKNNARRIGLDTGAPKQIAGARIELLIREQSVVGLFAPVWPCFGTAAHSLHTLPPLRPLKTPPPARKRARERAHARGGGGGRLRGGGRSMSMGLDSQKILQMGLNLRLAVQMFIKTTQISLKRIH